MTDAYIYDAARTPRGKGKKDGSLHEVKPVDLLGGLLDSLRERHPDMDPAGIEDIVLGCVTPVGDQGADIARTAAIKAGMPENVAGVQLNRFCGSGLEAVNQVAARVRSGFEDLLIAGGVESMSRVPMGSDGGAWAMDPRTALETDFVPQGINPPNTSEVGPPGDNPNAWNVVPSGATAGQEGTTSAAVYDPSTGEYVGADGAAYRQLDLGADSRLDKDADLAAMMTNGVA